MNEKALERAHADPGRYLAGEKSRFPTRATHELLLFAISRLARTRSEDAAAQLQSHAAVLGPDDTRYGWAQIAHAAAQAHHPRALEWYAEAGEGPFTDAQLQWKVRAALRAGDWAAVRAAVNLMSPEEARDPAWRYWLARALADGGRAAGGRGDTQAARPGTPFLRPARRRGSRRRRESRLDRRGRSRRRTSRACAPFRRSAAPSRSTGST